ncbi:hypothetical protein PPYR_07922 [Photinus pyralis]|uniref:Cyclin-dependent kinase inhibitor domain-containing protein n=1 Tax=Photinus pyralis TaxID=7054 RepID=A0A1Y1K0D1_PHOPY|nr:uncharacterized protein LOC116167694 [Photinus pyralis]KAB0800042.1 hypothetical protein PPYR_07922 [Photinus pyralis]
MSARVFKPIAFAEIPKIRSSPSIEGSFVYKGFAKVRRSLFNADPGETRRFVDEELAKLANDKCEKWEFDFVACKPKDVIGRYEWHKVTPPKVVSVPSTPKKHNLFDSHQEVVCNEFLYPPIESSSRTSVDDDDTISEFSDIHTQPNIPKKQSLITDFMQTRKRCEEPSLKKKLKRNTNASKPKKLVRMSLADSGS